MSITLNGKLFDRHSSENARVREYEGEEKEKSAAAEREKMEIKEEESQTRKRKYASCATERYTLRAPEARFSSRFESTD